MQLITLIAGLLIVCVLISSILIVVNAHIKRIKDEEQKKLKLVLEHQKELLVSNLNMQEKERQRIAADIHDDVIGQMRSLMLQSNHKEVTSALKEIIKTTRNISHDLYPPLLSQLSFYDLVNGLLEDLPYSYTSSLTNLRNNTLITEEIKLHLYRIIKELISNTLVHAKASSIHICFRNSSQSLILVYTDNGIGIQQKKISGLGMKNIEMRVNLIGAKFKFKENTPSGLKFILFLSYKN